MNESPARQFLGTPLHSIDALNRISELARKYPDYEDIIAAEVLSITLLMRNPVVLRDSELATLESLEELVSGWTWYGPDGEKDIEPLCLFILEIHRPTMWANTISTVSILEGLAYSYFKQDLFTKADSTFLEALSMHESVYGKPHQGTFDFMLYVIEIYDDMEKWEIAESWADRLTSQIESTGVIGSRSRLEVMRRLIQTYNWRDSMEKAEELLDRWLQLCVPTANDEHEDVLAFVKRLVDYRLTNWWDPLHNNNGALDAAESLQRRALSVFERILGAEHRTTLCSMQNLADVFHHQGRTAERETLELQVFETRARILGEEHLDTVDSMARLASTYFSQGRVEESKELDLWVLSVRRRVLSNKHKDTLEIMDKMVRIYPALYQLRAIRSLHDVEPLTAGSSQMPSNSYGFAPVLFDGWPSPDSQINNQPECLPSLLKLMGPENILPTTVSRDSDPPSDHLHHDRMRISSNSSVSDALDYLIDQRCTDLTPRIDLSDCAEAALSGGRFGDVWLGQLDDRTQVAIKCLRLHAIENANPKIIKHATKEICLWSKLKHPNVLELLGFALYEEQLAMISPWMHHGTLSDYIRKYPEISRWELGMQVAEGLAYIHNAPMVHGDLKASNVLVSIEGIVKISDFGNSIFTDGSLGFSSTNTAGGGTSRWMAPELIQREDADAASRSMPADVYALGMTLLEVMTGKMPFCEYRHSAAVTFNVTKGKHPRRPAELAEGTPFGDQRWDLLMRCWRMLPEERPLSVDMRNHMAFLA